MGKKSSEILQTDNRLDSVAIIMDGNGRWALSRGLPREAGHAAGVRAVERAAEAFFGAGVHYLTLYAFSTENWRRPEMEVSSLMELFHKSLCGGLPDKLRKNGIRLRFIGDIPSLPADLCRRCTEVERLTVDGSFTLNIALNYGGRSEIVRAVSRAVEHGELELTEQILDKYMYTYGTPDPDLIIRTGGDVRISNFLIWQSAYSELLFTDTLWPDFGEADVGRCIEEFYRRNRRFGGLGASSEPQ